MSYPRTRSDVEAWQPEARKPLGASFARLADWLGRALWLCCAISAVSLVVELWGSSAPESGMGAGQVLGTTIPDFDAVSAMVSLVGLVALIVTGVIWLAWQHLAASAAGGELRRSPGAHVGSWFVPVANLWLVPQNLADLWRTYRAPRRRSEVPPGPPVLVYVWWLTWIAASVANVGAAVVEVQATTPADLQLAGLLRSVGALVTALAAGIAAKLVRLLSWYALLVHADAA